MIKENETDNPVLAICYDFDKTLSPDDMQAQGMQRQMEETTKELEAKEYTAAAGGGAVSVTVSGKKEVTAVKISPEAVDPDDVEMLEDLIMAATNEAFRQLEEANNNAMSKLTGGMGGLGGGFPF